MSNGANRPYQRAFEPDFAVKTITRLAGARFDAKIVTAFLRAFEAGQIQGLQRAPKSPERLRSAAARNRIHVNSNMPRKEHLVSFDRQG